MSNNEVDESLYSRQLYVYGHEAQKKLQSSSILLVNAASQTAGLAVEIAKNVILAGVNSFTFMDNNTVEIADLGAQFYLSETDVGKTTRARASINKLSSLNPYVKVAIEEEELSQSMVARYSVVVLCGATIPEQIRINEWCRQANAKFIAADSPGVFLSVFVDDGDAHVVTDADGQECQRGLVAFISNDERGIVTLAGEQRHGLADGSYVRFEEVEGMTALNQAPPQRVRVVSPHAFSIGDTRTMGEFTGTRAQFVQVKMPETLSFAPLASALARPVLVNDIMGDAAYSHAFALALSRFRVAHARMPSPTSAADADAVVALLAEELKAVDGGYTLSDDLQQRFWALARVASCGLSPVAAVGGGIVGQEVLKAVSSKFTPIRQFLYWADVNALPTATRDADLSSFAARGCRYDAYVGALGSAVVQRLHQQRLFLVGAGAIGCEMLKGWAVMGVATAEGAEVTLTDMDTIEKSNLNRQFLFRAADVGKLKSEAAAAAARAMNTDMHVTAHSLKVAKETEGTYNDAFWASLTGVYTALDNVDARLFVDEKCVFYRKPMVDSGTLGTAGNTQVVVPGLTESYGSTRDPPEQGIPICTLKNFPYKIEHTIQWARDVFEGDFRQAAEEVNNYLSQKGYVSALRQQPNTFLPTLKTIHKYLVAERPSSFPQCIVWARQRFDEEFDHKIQQLLATFPPTATTSEGTPFWSGTKRQPQPLQFDAEDPAHMAFIVAAANLHAFNYNLHGHGDLAEYKAVLADYAPAPFTPAKVKIATTEEEAKNMASDAMTDVDVDAAAQAVEAALPPPESLAGYRLNPVEFEKDDDTNFHIAFITACSNLRARNYQIQEETAHMTKFIAGKIIPAIATTTALVTGLVCLEMIKIVQDKPLEAYRNTFASLAVNIVNPCEPFPPAVTKTVDGNGRELSFTLWDKVEVELAADATMGQLVEELKRRYNGTVSMLTYGSSILYMDFGMGVNEATKARLGLPLRAAIADVTKEAVPEDKRFLVLEASLAYDNEDGDEVDIEIPSVRVQLA